MNDDHLRSSAEPNRKRRSAIGAVIGMLCTESIGQVIGYSPQYQTGPGYSSLDILRIPYIGVGSSHEDMRDIKNYLTRFGYLRPLGYLSSDFQLDSRTSHAIKRFQRMHGISESGALDGITKVFMAAPRCAMPDWNDPLGALSIGGWKKKHLTYCFGKLSERTSRVMLTEAIRRAFTTWSAQPALGLEFTEVSNPIAADIFISWVKAADSDRNMMGPMVAHADFPPGYSLIAKSGPLPLHFDDEETKWTVDGQGMDMETIALHEIGHCLGLVHSSTHESIMFPVVREGRIAVDLHSSDIEMARALYP